MLWLSCHGLCFLLAVGAGFGDVFLTAARGASYPTTGLIIPYARNRRQRINEFYLLLKRTNFFLSVVSRTSSRVDTVPNRFKNSQSCVLRRK